MCIGDHLIQSRPRLKQGEAPASPCLNCPPVRPIHQQRRSRRLFGEPLLRAMSQNTIMAARRCGSEQQTGRILPRLGRSECYRPHSHRPRIKGRLPAGHCSHENLGQFSSLLHTPYCLSHGNASQSSAPEQRLIRASPSPLAPPSVIFTAVSGMQAVSLALLVTLLKADAALQIV